MKKIFLLILVLILPVILYTACNFCDCPPISEKFYTINSITVKPSATNNAIVDQGFPVNIDTLNLSYEFGTRCTASSKSNPFSAFVNTAYACSCESCGDDGIKVGIKSINITSNLAYSNSYPANSSLNPLFFAKIFNYNQSNNRISIDSIIKKVNEGYSLRQGLILFTSQKPTISLTHSLKLSIELEDGKKFEVSTLPIIWL